MSGRRPRLAEGLLLAGAGFLVRLPTLGLPVLGGGALHATWAAQLGREQGLGVPGASGQGPLLALLLAVPVAAGAPPTAALRWTTALLGALIAPLAAALVRRAGLGGGAARWGGLLLAVHPALALLAGGAVAGPAPLALVLLLLAGLGLAAAGPTGRRFGLLAGLLAPLAQPGALVWLPALALVAARRERVRALAAAGVALAAVVLVLAALRLPGLDGAGLPGRLAVVLALGPGLAPLGVLLPGLPRGLAAFARTATGRTVLGCALLEAGLAVALGPRAAAPVAAAALGIVPVLLVAGLAGTREGEVGRPRLALGLALVGSLFAASGSLESELLPRAHLPTAARAELARALERAAAIAGEGGDIAVDVPDLDDAEVARLADLVPAGRLGRARSVPGGDPAALFPWAEIPPQRTVAVLTTQEDAPSVATWSGTAIFNQVPVERVGRYVILATRRP